MKTTKITQTRHFKKIAAGAMAMILAAAGTMMALPSGSTANEDLFGGRALTLPANGSTNEASFGSTKPVSPKDGETKGKLLGIAGFSAAAKITESGSCGENATWTLDTNGKLTISGTGAMDDLINDDMQPWKDLRSSITSVEIEDGITTIGKYAFAYCTHLTTAAIANSVTSIGADAFNCCTALTSAEIPEGIASIGFEAFYQCTDITYVEIPSSVTEINDNAFFGCTKCTEINIDVTDPGKLTWKDSNDDFMPNKQTQCSIPQGTLDGYNGAFGATVNVKFVDDQCGDNATWEYDSNGTLTISGTGDMYDFGSGHTGPWKEYRDRITTVVIEDGITSIGSGAFYNCRSVTSVTIPDSVTSIGIDAFNGDEQLTEINIPASVTTIDKYAFFDCKAMKTVTFAEGSKLTAIGETAFASCGSLTEITIPEGVETIGKKAFAYCSDLTSVTIPSTVTLIDDNAFVGCTSCKNVYMLVTDPNKLTWDDKDLNDFGAFSSTKCYVAHDVLDAFITKFDGSVNVSFYPAH